MGKKKSQLYYEELLRDEERESMDKKGKKFLNCNRKMVTLALVDLSYANLEKAELQVPDSLCCVAPGQCGPEET